MWCTFKYWHFQIKEEKEKKDRKGKEKKTRKKKALTVSLEIYSFYAWVEAAFVLVGFFFEEMVAFSDLASF